MTETPEGLPYRPCVGVMLLNHAGRVFVGHRVPDEENPTLDFPWQMPQGGVDPGEDLRAAARRELAEETNVTSVSFLAESPRWYSYDIPAGLSGGKMRRWRGQAQKWFAFRFEGAESEINVAHPLGGHTPEFSAWKWVALDELPALAVPFKRGVYKRVVADFRHLAP